MTIFKNSYAALLNLLCVAAASVAAMGLGHACRTILYEPPFPDKLLDAND